AAERPCSDEASPREIVVVCAAVFVAATAIKMLTAMSGIVKVLFDTSIRAPLKVTGTGPYRELVHTKRIACQPTEGAVPKSPKQSSPRNSVKCRKGTELSAL